MSCYVIESDKLFIRCKDIKVMEVYRIDSLYIAPLQQKHWTRLATVQFGDGRREFEALQIGDRDIIRGRDLERLMQALMPLGIMVNREGLCFLKIPENNISDQYQVDYYRLFDLFDWSNYHVKSKMNTRWTRNDIADGRHMFDYCMETLSDKEAELKEIIHQHSKQQDELNRRHGQEIKELQLKRSVELAALKRIMGELEEVKQNHSRDLHELKRNHTEEKAAFERIKEEMEHKHCEGIKELKRKHTEELAACECEQRNVKSYVLREEDSDPKIDSSNGEDGLVYVVEVMEDAF